MRTIGITTTVPIEVLLAAGYLPVDLNNLFISAPDKDRLVGLAERAGFPQNLCTWIKGIYGAVLDRGIDTVLGVTTGDCSNTTMLLEVLRLKGVNTIPFAFPDRPNIEGMHHALELLAGTVGTNLTAAEEVRLEMAESRRLALELDERTWWEGTVSGFENHLWLVSTSDFNGQAERYSAELRALLAEADNRVQSPNEMLRLAFVGVPPIFAEDFYTFLEQNGARVVFNEVQRQFAMPEGGESLAEQYSYYTYPYSFSERLRDILPELRRRRVDGVVHYVQAFCHRGIGDIILRHAVKLPILTLEGNSDYHLSHHTRTRIEAFLDMMRRFHN